MKVIAVVNEKGGVGKTVTAVTLMCGLAARHKRVIGMDFDEQGHVCRALGLSKSPGVFDLMQRNKPWADVLLTIPPEKFLPPGRAAMDSGHLLIVPGDIETRALPYTMRPDGLQLRKRIQQLENAVDYVVIDTGPAASLLHILIYSAADYILYPTKTEELSFDGLLEALGHLEGASAQRTAMHPALPPVEVLGIIPTMFRSNSLEHKVNLKALQEAYGDLVWDSVAERTLWAESLASASGFTPVYAHAPSSPAARDAWKMIDRVLMTIEGVRREQTA